MGTRVIPGKSTIVRSGIPFFLTTKVNVMESLHLSFQRVEEAGMFKCIKLDNSVSISHMFYADDAVFVGQWCESNINSLVHVLEYFFRASGLRINMSKSVLRKLESIRSHFFNDFAPDCNKASWVNWKIALASKEKGGLGKGIDLRKFICFKLGNEEKTRFWDDRWLDGESLKMRFPRVYALELCKDITIASKVTQHSLVCSLRRRPRRGVEQQQFEELLTLINGVRLVPMGDWWTWKLSSSGEFSVASVRSLIDDKTLPDAAQKTRWVRYVPIKVNVIAWKVKSNSLPTRFNISRRGIPLDSIKRGICDTGGETVSHLFFSCDLVRQLVRLIARWWDVPYVGIESYADWVSWIENLRLSFKNKIMLDGVFYVLWWGCNSSFITLVPKVDDPLTLGDFRPISLIGCQYKIIGKVLVNRLSKVISSVVGEVQMAFIKGCQIIDGPLMVDEIISWESKQKRRLMLFKVDFEKAFDYLSWNFLLSKVEQMGFSSKWRNWILSCLNSSFASVLINGSPTMEFKLERGLRQGDPLSPFLFIIAVEALNIAILEATNRNIFYEFKVGRDKVHISHLQFADDTLFIRKWSLSNAKNLSRILTCFHLAFGLKVNFNKSKLFGIGVFNLEVNSFASSIGCLASHLPCSYLGLLIGAKMS
nr:putative RNA-directed DNA polymerase, eukaryota, reverse transcriptase zinc-binding domain protein [Tanacetum cinerariifolium]